MKIKTIKISSQNTKIQSKYKILKKKSMNHQILVFKYQIKVHNKKITIIYIISN